jgi:formylglycine-generating enzyme required for sulfatase activity
MRYLPPFLLVTCLAFPALAQEKKYALIVGVKRYDGKPFTPLPSAEKDALAMERALQEIGFHLVISMTDEAKLATRRPTSAKNILEQLDLLLQGKEHDDTILVFLSGHGIQLKGDPVGPDGNKETYFCPEEAKVRDKSSLVAIGEVMRRLAACPARRKLLLIDSCREEMLADDAPEKSGGTIELEPVRVRRPPPPAGLAVLFSCSPGETSHAFKKLGDQGVFTHFTLKYLRGEADANRYRKDELLTSELAAYVSRETNDYVVDQLGKQQVPELVTPSGLRPWPLGTRPPTIVVEGRTAGERLVVKTSGIDLPVRWCPPGTFMMGSPKDEEGRDDNEDQVQVELTRGFWLAETEVTQGLWQNVMGTTPWKEGDMFTKEGMKHPATWLSWDDTQKFCDKLTDREQKERRLTAAWEYRLPTEAEWEYGCRSGTTGSYNGDGNGELGDYAWYEANSSKAGERFAHEVGLKKANSWGLLDMHGNVDEWCADGYTERLPGGRDPFVLNEGTSKVSRGGGWDFAARKCRSAARGKGGQSGAIFDLGFRPALSPAGR